LQNATFFCEIGDRPRFLQTHTDGKGGVGREKEKIREGKEKFITEARRQEKRKRGEKRQKRFHHRGVEGTEKRIERREKGFKPQMSMDRSIFILF